MKPIAACMSATFLSLVLGAGCDSAGTADNTVPPDDATPHVDVHGEYTLQPGEETYLCYTLTVPAGFSQAITRLVPTYGKGTHHILFSQTIAPEPSGMSECKVLSKDTWLPLYAAGQGVSPVNLPAGTALRLVQPEQQLVLQLHLQNASPNPLTAKSTMRVEFAQSAKGLTWAGIFGLDNHQIHLPPHSQAVTSSMSCVPGKELGVFAVLGHMHKHGRHLELSRGTMPGQEILFDEDWNFDEQPLTMKTMQISKTDQLFLRCQHDNNTDVPIAYGESSDTEMCAAVLYYTPFESLDGCTQQ